jgi:hypothetical protein
VGHGPSRSLRIHHRAAARIIDDSGMRELASTAAEELLEIVMRHERASTLLTSNRPVED